jgi:rod shape-determining protein MreB and related proteins
MRRETQLPVYLADSPLTCVATGAGHSLEELPVIQRVSRRRRNPPRKRRWRR